MKRPAVLGVAIVLGTFGSPVAEAAGSKAHAVVSQVRTSARFVAPGGSVTAQVKLKRAGQGRIGPAKVGLVLAGSAKPKGGIALAGKPVAAAIGKGGAAVIVTGTLPAKAKPGKKRLVACIDAKHAVARGPTPGACGAAPGKLRIARPGRTGSVDVAVRRGRLDSATAALYRLYALTGDTRLPAKYASAIGDADGHAAITEAAARYPLLPGSIQQAVFPFFVPPAATNSALGTNGRAQASAAGVQQGPVNCQGFDTLATPLDQEGQFKGTWRAVPSGDGNALVHYVTWEPIVPNRFGSPIDQLTQTANQMSAEARSAAARYALAMPKIWSKLTREFGAPQSDVNEPCYNGGDGRLDIYVDPSYILRANEPGATAFTWPYPQVGTFCTDRPAFIVIDRREEPWTLAHEFMHALQFAHRYKSCGDAFGPIAFWDEGGANWAADFVYPSVQREQTREPHNSMLKRPLGWSPVFADYQYWPFWMMLQRNNGTAVLRAVFAALSNASPLDAVNQAIPGGWNQQLPKLLISLWNQTPIGARGFPIHKSYKAWDNYHGTPPVPEEIKLRLGGRQSVVKKFPGTGDSPSPLELGTIQRISIPDSKLREVRFTNGGAGHGVHVDAALHLRGGGWKLADWTGGGTLCRDKKEEDASELIVFTTGVSTTQGFRATHRIQGRSQCALPKYVAQVSGTETTDTVGGECHLRWEVSYNASTAPAWFYLPHPEGGPPETGQHAIQESGTGTFTQDPCDPDPGCTATLVTDKRATAGDFTFDLQGSNIKVTVVSVAFQNAGTNDCGGDPPVGVGKIGVGTFPRSLVGAPTITVQLSHDDTFSGRHAVGSGTITLHRVN